MEEQVPINGGENHSPEKPARPKQKPTHLPGASPAPNKYPKSGSEEEFWKRCEEATRLRARHKTYPEIAAALNVDTSTAHRMVARYLQGAARFYSAIQHRELIAIRYRELSKITMEELERIQDGKLSTEKRLACIARAESLVAKEAQLYGFVSVGADINIIAGGEADPAGRPLPSAEDQRRLRQLARQLREIREGTQVEEAQFTVTDDGKDKGNGDQGKGDANDG